MDKALQFERIARLAIACKWLVFGVDEFDEFCTAGHTTALDRKTYKQVFGNTKPALYQIANYSRHHKMAFIASSRRPAQVARELTSQYSELRVFRMTEAGDISYFAGILGESVAERLKTLADYTYLRARDGQEPEIAGGFDASVKR